jgi:hypothetical protein
MCSVVRFDAGRGDGPTGPVHGLEFALSGSIQLVVAELAAALRLGGGGGLAISTIKRRLGPALLTRASPAETTLLKRSGALRQNASGSALCLASRAQEAFPDLVLVRGAAPAPVPTHVVVAEAAWAASAPRPVTARPALPVQHMVASVSANPRNKRLEDMSVFALLKSLHVDTATVSAVTRWKLAVVLHATLNGGVETARMYNTARAAFNLVLCGKAGSRSGTTNSRTRNADLEELGAAATPLFRVQLAMAAEPSAPGRLPMPPPRPGVALVPSTKEEWLAAARAVGYTAAQPSTPSTAPVPAPLPVVAELELVPVPATPLSQPVVAPPPPVEAEEAAPAVLQREMSPVLPTPWPTVALPPPPPPLERLPSTVPDALDFWGRSVVSQASPMNAAQPPPLVWS